MIIHHSMLTFHWDVKEVEQNLIGLWSTTSVIELLRLLGKVGDGLSSTTSAAAVDGSVYVLSLIHISEPTRPY